MERSFAGFAVMGALLTSMAAMASTGDSKDEAIKKDRQQIQGTWRAVSMEVNGEKTTPKDGENSTVVNGPDGTWTLHENGKVAGKGTSTIDPTKKPKTIDFTVTEGDGKGEQFVGIYELGEKTRKLCFVPRGMDRPTEFSAPAGSDRILVTFERDEAK